MYHFPCIMKWLESMFHVMQHALGPCKWVCPISLNPPPLLFCHIYLDFDLLLFLFCAIWVIDIMDGIMVLSNCYILHSHQHYKWEQNCSLLTWLNPMLGWYQMFFIPTRSNFHKIFQRNSIFHFLI